MAGGADQRCPQGESFFVVAGEGRRSAVGDEDRPAAYLKQPVGPADNREASRDRGIDQHREMLTAHGWRMRRPQDPAVLAARLPLGGDV
jgi:hypothetical protein